jgi:hypothetical protein
MKDYHHNRYLQLKKEGIFFERIKIRSDHLFNMRMKIFDDLQEKNPRPETDNILEVEKHLKGLLLIAEELIKEEIYEVI